MIKLFWLYRIKSFIKILGKKNITIVRLAIHYDKEWLILSSLYLNQKVLKNFTHRKSLTNSMMRFLLTIFKWNILAKMRHGILFFYIESYIDGEQYFSDAKPFYQQGNDSLRDIIKDFRIKMYSFLSANELESI